jgi:hypothetical protein
MTEAYGQRLGEAMRAKNSPTIVTRALRAADMAVRRMADERRWATCGPARVVSMT